MNQATNTARPWLSIFTAHARANPRSAIIMGVASAASLALLAAGIVRGFWGEAGEFLDLAIYGGLIAGLATALGAAPALALRRIPVAVQDMMLGFAAGMMLSASAFSLLLPGLEAGAELLGDRLSGSVPVIVGMGLGVLLMLGLDQFTPHEHETTGPFGPQISERVGRIWLFVFAIALHNLPEGMAIGVGFSKGDMSVGLPLTVAIALQDMPEGLAVALTLRSIGLSPLKAVLIAAATGLLEPLGAVVGVGITGGGELAYPVGLGLAAGAMVFVVSHEVIPETHRNGHQTVATVGVLIGFALMMTLDTALG